MDYRDNTIENTSNWWGSEEARKLLQQVGETFRAISEKTPPSIKSLAKHGWYIPFDSIPGEVFGYAEALEKGQIDLVNRKMIDVFENGIDNIISRACTQFPDRKNILMEAKQAHENKMYFSSTILFLSNADGILNGRLYKSEALKQEFKDQGIGVNEFTDFLTKDMPIKVNIPHNNKPVELDYLNRHGVMHGRDTRYGTKTNSLKALSLLDYVAVFVLP